MHRSRYKTLIISDVHFDKPQSRANMLAPHVLTEGWVRRVKRSLYYLSPPMFFKDSWIEAFQSRAKNFDAVIINGDFFDFEAMTVSFLRGQGIKTEEINEKIFESGVRGNTNIAKIILHRILESCPNTKFIYNAGNHDCFEVFYQKLSELEEEFEGRFFWSPQYSLLGERNLITHGDIEQRGYTPEQREKKRYTDFKELYQESSFSNRAAEEANKQAKKARRSYYQDKKRRLEDIAKMDNYFNSSPALSKVTNVVYSHVHHNPFTNQEYSGRYYNQTGGFYRGNETKVLTMDILAEGSSLEITKNGCGSILIPNATDMINLELATMMPFHPLKESPVFSRAS